MSEHELETLMARLREELSRMDEDQGEARQRLEGLLANLEHRLAHPREDNEDSELIETLQAAIERFEIEHPRATGIVNQIMVTLSSMGI
ncbi:MAG: DUF4404 family protein [Gammaproteobacteria bacterium]|nr:DUF4404 family protein [Gammaproteobacteria bacterium]